MIKNILILGLTFFHFYVPAQNFSITYGFPEVTTSTGLIDPSNTPTVNGLNFHSFRSTGTSLNPSASARFSFTGWPIGSSSGDDNYGNYVAVLSPTIYFEVKISIDEGYSLRLNSLNFDVRRSGTGVRTYCVRSSLDNFTNNLAASTGTNSNLEIIPNDIFFWKYDSISTNNDQKGSRIDFNAFFSALTDSVSFRFYAWNSEAVGGSFSIDNVNFIGTVTDLKNSTSIDTNFGIEQAPLKLNVFPNPSGIGSFNIESKVAFSEIDIMDANGKIYYSEIYERPINSCEIKNLELADGLYFLRVSSKTKSQYHSLIIKK